MVETQLNGIAEKAKRCPEERFTSLAHLLNEEHLKICFEDLKAHKAVGVDGVTKEEYAKALDSNIVNLVSLMKQHAFRPAPSRRVYIPKAGSDKKRPLGIPTLESKLVQMAMRRVLDRIYEAVFLDSSFGFRPGRSAHGALKKVDALIRTGQYHWVAEVDIEGFFDNVNHEHLMEFLKIKILDPNILRLIVRFLKAGIWEEGRYLKTETGTPQGGVISPLLANIYLHYALDLWFEEEFKARGKGKSELVRYADDFIVCFEFEEDARRFHEAIQTRFEGFGLRINKDKTKTIAFSPRRLGTRSQTFDFLGLTHYVGLSRTGYPRMKRRTSAKRFRMKVVAFKEWIKQIRSEIPLKQIWESAKLKLLGHYRYYGVTDNYERIAEYRYRVEVLLYKWLNRRSQKKSMNWDRFRQYLRRYPLPYPRIYTSVFA